ncbi:toprim domain-containing protein, partial [Rosenbergiella australiborealis]|uniref:toprim domain-containing protein n=2 Tax=Rosenbergiella TaxID=1356488 RepID=UPI001F4D3A75
MRNIDLINQVTTEAAGNWPYILQSLSIAVPDNPRKHAPCPHCGGNDRFRFDDKGKGNHICNHCGAGDGLDLIKKVNNCDTTEAAKMVADVLNIDYRVSESDPIADQKRRDELTAKRTKQAEAQRKREELEKAERKEQFTRNYSVLSAKTTTGESEYLIAKGLNGIDCQLLPDGSILLPLTDGDANLVAAQTIPVMGIKKHLAGSAKQGSYHAVNAPDDVQTVILAEGYATALSVSLMRPDALTVAAIDAGNLTPVAEVMRFKYPHAQIIIAADNDHHDDEPNTGELAAIKAAKAVSGWLTMPQGDHKADWDDYRQQYGLGEATRAFNEGMYQPEGTSMTATLQVIDGGKEDKKQGDPLKPHVKSRKDGVYWITPKVDKVSGEVINNESWLASPLEVIGTGRDDKDQYLILRWKPYGENETVTAPLPLADIGEREGWRTLKAGGVNIT